MDLTAASVAKRLKEADRILILTHQSPDGDTLGSGFGLQKALDQLGKRSAVLCSDPFSEKYAYFTEERPFDFEPELVVAVDIAAVQLFGEKLMPYAERVDICIDHHVSNTRYAKDIYLDTKAAAVAEMVLTLVKELGADVTPQIATALYTGIATDTGCFKFSNTTAATHRAAAELIDCGADYVRVNRLMFDTKSRARVKVEQEVLRQMEFFFDGQCAMIVVPKKLIEESGADEADLDGVSGMPKQIEGVKVGLTLREKNGFYKVSVRTTMPVNASEICTELDGGGHPQAAGCVVKGPFEEAKKTLLNVVKRHL